MAIGCMRRLREHEEWLVGNIDTVEGGNIEH